MLIPWLLVGLHAQTAHFSYAEFTLGSGFNLPSGVAVDRSGNIFVADTFNNAVKEILAADGYSTIITLGSGFDCPYGVAVDKKGNVYVADFTHQAVKEIVAVGGSIPASPTINTLGSGFNGPIAVAVDGNGNVFVANYGNNEVKEIVAVGGTIPASPTIYTLGSGFSYPSGVAVDGNGNVFVADYGHNAMKEIVAVSGSVPAFPTINSWSITQPFGVALDASGNVFVADTYDGAVKEIVAVGGSVPASPTINTLVSGNSPYGVAVDGSGNVFVTDTSTNRILKLETASADFGTVAIGQKSAASSLAFTFDSGGTIGNAVALTQGAAGLDFAVVIGGTCTAGTYNAGGTCTVNVIFTPKFAGLRNGAVLLQDGSGNTLATAYVHGIGSGPQVSFLPGTVSEFSFSNIDRPEGIAVDGAGNLYVMHTLYNSSPKNVVVKETWTGSGYTQSMVANAFSGYPVAIAVDGAGNVYIVDENGEEVLKETPSSGGYTQSIVAEGLQILGSPVSVAVDVSGYVYIGTESNGVLKATLTAAGYTLSSAFSAYANDLAVDRSGNFYIVSDNQVLKYAPSGGGYIMSTILSGQNYGVIGPDNYGSLAVDGTGNLYVPIYELGKIVKVTFSEGSQTQTTIATNLTGALAVDGSGNIFVANYEGGNVFKLDVADAPSLKFAETAIGQASAAQDVTVVNFGNAPLLFQPFVADNLLDAMLASTGSTDCTELTGLQLAPGAACTLGIEFEPAQSGLVHGHVNVVNNALNAASPNYATQSIAVQGTGTIPPPVVSLSANSLAFGNVPVNTESVYRPVTLTNTGGSPLAISSFALTGTNKTQFLISSNYCPASLAAGANCIIHLHFYPNVPGPATAALTITDNATGSPQSVTLTGTGATPAVFLSATTLTFGNVPVNTESVYQGVTVTNTGGSPLTISSIALTGTNKTQFLISGNTCPASLAAGADCTIHLHFYPQITGAATASLTITDNATGSPQSVSLTGTALTPAAVSMSATSLAFGSVPVNTESVYLPVILTNTGGSPLTISSVALTGTNKAQFLISGNTCPASLAAGANCTIHLHFYPQVTGAATAALTIADNATGSPQSVSLTGTATPPPAVSLTTTSLVFGSVPVNTESLFQGVTVTNTGGSPLTITSIALTGTNKTQFLISSNYCPASLAAGANCTIHLHFYPQVTGAATAALTITDNATGSPQSVTLTGTATPPAVASLSATSLAFGSVPVNTESVYQGVTLTNTGGSPLTISSVALTGAQFLISSDYCPASLAAGASCTIHLHFCPQVTGAAAAALTITDNSTGSPQSVALTGTGK